MKHFKLFLLINILILNLISAQNAAYFNGEVLVQLVESTENNLQRIIKDLSVIDGVNTNLSVEKRIAPNLSIWLLKFDEANISVEEMIRNLALHPQILVAQKNHKVEFRSTNTPNDLLFTDQWQYINPGGNGGLLGADMDADSAWAITTGGVTSFGDTIVVCVIDGGIQEDHPDWGDNIWVNRHEVTNGIDSDGNGFIDDVKGWNTEENNDNIGRDFASHGTPVAGIIGAKGNNGVGVAGVNWDVKMMIVEGGGGEADALAAYAYPLAMRKLYNQTNGEKGAFVVATNASWGVNFGRAADAPLWCSMYDTLGKYGILNAGATINSNINVDIQGDLPTECPSDYLISVTNLGRNDIKVNQAGFGATTIDIGSYGQDAFTMVKAYVNFMGDTIRYEGFGGTSGASPHVAGAIALLYSAECQSFNDLYQNYPDSAALKIKEYILEGGEDNASLQDKTVTGKKLNLHGALKKMLEDCVNCPNIASTIPTNITENSAQIALGIDGEGDITGFTLEYREVGEVTWSVALSSINMIQLMNLNPKTLYEYRVKTECGEFTGKTSDINFFSTVGVSVSNIATQNQILVYPNPNKGIITIQNFGEQTSMDVKFYDVTGKLVHQQNQIEDGASVNIQHLQNGVYIMKLYIEVGESFSQKVVKY